MSHLADLVFDLDSSDLDSQAYLGADNGEDWDVEPKPGRRYPYRGLGAISVWDSEGLVNHWVECLGCDNVNRIQVQHVTSLPREIRGYHSFYCPNCGKFNGRYRSDVKGHEATQSFESITGTSRFKKECRQWEKRFRQEHCKRIIGDYLTFRETFKHWYKRHPEYEGRHFFKLLNDLAKAVYGPIEELSPVVSCH